MLLAIASVFVLALCAPWLYRRLGAWCGSTLALLPAALAIYFAAYAAPQRDAYEWAPALSVTLSLVLDGLSRLFALLITGIGAVVLVYAGAYLHGHERLGRFYMYLLAFMGSMLGLVLADNLLLLFVFWELTSFSSFLLIGFEHHRAAARSAALQALLVTAGGGLLLLAGVLLLGIAASSFELSELAARRDAIQAHPLYAPSLVLLFGGAVTKSAQLPFHFWLPNAMEAPTPVSAYLHSSTMVKAGVYLVARLLPILGGTALWHVLVGGVGLVTTLTGAALAVAQTDLKRVLAYSTISALGLMMLLLGLDTTSALTAAVVLVVAHALYKGALFLVAGSVAHATGERDYTRLGGLRRAMPFTAAAAVLAAASMAGVLPFVGFAAKELALEVAWHTSRVGALLLPAITASSALLVVAACVAGVRPFVRRSSHPAAHEGPPALWAGALGLAAAGLVAGLAPQLWVDWLAAPAVAALAGVAVPVSLSLWHGWTAPLLAGLTALGGGILLFARSDRWRPSVRRGVESIRGPAHWYTAGFDGLNRLAAATARPFQRGELRHYLFVVVSTSVIVLVGTFARTGSPFEPFEATTIRFYEAFVVAALIVGVVAAVRVASRLAAVATLGGIGACMALLFAMLGAPDLAMTQFVVEALLVILFVLTFYDLPPAFTRRDAPVRAIEVAIAVAGGLAMGALVLVAATVQIQPTISGYFAEHSVEAAHGRNVVNVILVDFRAVDTLGEITVLAAAAAGVYAILKLRPRELRP
jgi:multicomponent Na+:H+ antiporter subunit A